MPDPTEVVLTPEAIVEIEGAYSWFEAQRKGLGSDFKAALDSCITLICQFPLANERVKKDYRRALLRRFRYAIYYECIENVITIHAVFHCSQSTRKLRKRLP